MFPSYDELFRHLGWSLLAGPIILGISFLAFRVIIRTRPHNSIFVPLTAILVFGGAQLFWLFSHVDAARRFRSQLPEILASSQLKITRLTKDGQDIDERQLNSVYRTLDENAVKRLKCLFGARGFQRTHMSNRDVWKVEFVSAHGTLNPAFLHVSVGVKQNGEAQNIILVKPEIEGALTDGGEYLVSREFLSPGEW